MRITDLARTYLQWFNARRGASPRTCECYDLTYSQFVAFLSARGLQNDIREFTPENVDAFASHLADAGRKASSVNVKLAALHSLGEYGKKTKDPKGRYLLAENPLDRVVRPKRVKPKEKYLYRSELIQFLRADKPPCVQLAIEVLVDTALRASEVAGAKVEHLSLDGERVRLSVVLKGGSPRVVTLGERVGAILLESLHFREARPEEPLLVNERGEAYTRTTLSEMVLRQAVRAGITRVVVRAHVLRHSIASLASASNVDVPTIAAMLNHSDIHTVARYVHRQEAVDAARDRVREVLR